jgi:hypothetical protein
MPSLKVAKRNRWGIPLVEAKRRRRLAARVHFEQRLVDCHVK